MSTKLWNGVEVEIARVGETAATTQLWAFNTTGVEISEDSEEVITLRAYFDAAPDAQALRQKIVSNLALIGLPEAALRRVEPITVADQDWLSEWKKGYEPVPIGQRLLIAPSWKREQVAASKDWAGRIVVEIDPGMAFGTGTHETTRGCLEMLEKHWPSIAESRALPGVPSLPRVPSLLDVGTGTGILAIAAIKLQPESRVIGFDVDPEAIEVANENAAINGVAEEIELEVNKLSYYEGQDFDLVLANLTADVIIPHAPEFPLVMRPGATLITSGILIEQTDEVIASLAAHGFSVIESKPDGEWTTIVLRLST